MVLLIFTVSYVNSGVSFVSFVAVFVPTMFFRDYLQGYMFLKFQRQFLGLIYMGIACLTFYSLLAMLTQLFY